MRETAPKRFDFEDDTAIVARFARHMLGDRLDSEDEECWRVVLDPEELGMTCGAVIVTPQQYFVLDSEPTEGRTTFRELHVGRSQDGDTIEVQGISGKTHLGNDHTPFDLGEFVMKCASQRFGGEVFWG